MNNFAGISVQGVSGDDYLKLITEGVTFFERRFNRKATIAILPETVQQPAGSPDLEYKNDPHVYPYQVVITDRDLSRTALKAEGLT